MKYLLFIPLFILASAFTNSNAQSPILNALKLGDASRISSYFDAFIDLKLPEKDELKTVGKVQASITFENFYEQNKINGFELSSQRELGNTMYITGKLNCPDRKFNITLMIKNKGDSQQIITVRIS